MSSRPRSARPFGLKLMDVGVTPELSLLEVRQVRTINGLAMAATLAQLLFVVISVVVQRWAAAAVNLAILVIACGPVLWLHARHQYRVARALAFIVPIVFGTLLGLMSARVSSLSRPEVLLLGFSVLGVLLFEGWVRRAALVLVITAYTVVQVVPHLWLRQPPPTAVWFHVINATVAMVLTYLVTALYRRDYARSQAIVVAQNRELADRQAQIERQADQLRESNGVKDRLFSIIAHDLRSPLAALQGLVGLMRREEMPPQESRQMLQDLSSHLDQTHELLANLLHWSRSQMQGAAPKPTRFDLHELVHGNAQLARASALAKSIELVATFDPPITVYADRAMLDLVIRNLLSNAIKFTPAHGTIRLTAAVDDDQTRIITCTDTGIGMSSEAVAEIAEGKSATRVGTAGEPGTGVGLLLVRDFVRANSSELEVTSTPGAGTRFVVRLPAPPLAT